MHNTLNQIIEKKKVDLEEKKKTTPLDNLKSQTGKGVYKSLFKEKMRASSPIAVIAEIKLASPTEPHLGSESDIIPRAAAYENAGAVAISIITEKHYFKGNTTFILKLKKKVSIPILQKDFVIDPYQIFEAKIIGSDALLFIARLVSKKVLKDFVAQALELGIEPVVEVHDEKDLEKALETATSIIAVNARNLETFSIDVSKACALLKKIPDKFLKLGFSGIHSAEQVEMYKKAGARGVLVGTSLMKTANIHDFINSLKT